MHVGMHVGARLVHVGARLGTRWCMCEHVGTRCYTWVQVGARWAHVVVHVVHVGVHVCARCQKTESFVTDSLLEHKCGGGSCGVS